MEASITSTRLPITPRAVSSEAIEPPPNRSNEARSPPKSKTGELGDIQPSSWVCESCSVTKTGYEHPCMAKQSSPTTDSLTSGTHSVVNPVVQVPSNPSFRHELVRIPSKLDLFDPNSELALSQYSGFAMLIFICSGFYLVANPIMRWYERGEFVDPTLAVAMFYDFFNLMFMWFKLSVWSLTAFFLHILFIKGIVGRHTLFVLQHLTQIITISYAVAHCLYNEWPVIPAAFVQIAAVVNFMKMHSYTESNLEFYYRRDSPDACVHYPGNVKLRDFCYYIVAPSLVYEPSFPRGNGFRPGYFIWKLISLISAMTVMYLACTSYLIPTISRSPTVSIMEAICNLIFPFLFLDLLIFFIIFECICNLLAEVTNFANRDFYHDWWNSHNWDEYSRKWNRPVHKFLLRHVYMETQHKYHWSQRSAALATFLFSALIHEMIMAVCFRFVRFYLLSLMLFQIPLIALGRLYAHNQCLSNGIFWASLLLGLPLLAVAYGREFAQNHFYGDQGWWNELRFI